MGIIKNIRSIFPLPKAWENDSDRKAFGVRIEQTLRDLFVRIFKVDESAVHKTGNENIKGIKRFINNGYFDYETTTRYGRFCFRNNSANPGGGEIGGQIWLDFGNATNQTLNQMNFSVLSPKSTPDAGNTGYSERYRLPAPAAGLTATKIYDIITTKDGTFKPIYRKSVTATTSGNGNINLSLTHADYIVICAIANTNGASIPIRFNSTNWGVHVVDASFAPVVNTSVTVTAFFMPRDGIPTL